MGSGWVGSGGGRGEYVYVFCVEGRSGWARGWG